MTVFRLLGIGVLFAVAMPQHGSGRTSEYIALRGTELPVAIAATGSDRRLVAVSPSESTRLRALRSNEADLFKSLREGARSCEGSACRGEQPAREDDASWMTNLRMPEIPVKPNERVRQYVEYFTENAEGRRIFRTWLKRSGRYSKTVSAQLREILLPQDLQAVVFI